MKDFFEQSCFTSGGMQHITVSEAYKQLNVGNAILVDVRETEFVLYKQFDVPNALCIPFKDFQSQIHKLPKDIPLIFADSAGIYSKEAVYILQDAGFQNVINLAGGIIDWERAGLPMRIDVKEEISGSCVCQLRKRNIKNNL